MSDKLDALVEQIGNLTMQEAADMAKMMEEKWGIQASNIQPSASPVVEEAKATKNDKVQQSSPRPFIKAGAKQNPTAISSKQREKAFQNMKQSGSVEDVARWIATPEKR